MEDSGDEDRDASNKNLAESAASIAKVARAHGEKVIDLKRDYGVPAVMACLTSRDGQESLGATVRQDQPVCACGLYRVILSRPQCGNFF